MLFAGTECPPSGFAWHYKCCGELNNHCCFHLQVCSITFNKYIKLNLELGNYCPGRHWYLLHCQLSSRIDPLHLLPKKLNSFNSFTRIPVQLLVNTDDNVCFQFKIQKILNINLRNLFSFLTCSISLKVASFHILIQNCTFKL